jgi:hypothetical protein
MVSVDITTECVLVKSKRPLTECTESQKKQTQHFMFKKVVTEGIAWIAQYVLPSCPSFCQTYLHSGGHLHRGIK